MAGTRWGVDLGGTKIEVAVVDEWGRDHRFRKPTEQVKGYDHLLGQIQRAIEEAESSLGIKRPTRMGLSHPGCIDPDTGKMKNSNTQCLNGQAVAVDLGHRLGCEIVAANDANCFALAEACLGAAVGFRVVFGVILGTGVGGGLVVDGQVIAGHHRIAGEWGHIVIEPEGEPCYCGRRGCVETLISGPALERQYCVWTGVQRPLAEIMNRADEADTTRLTKTLCERFGRCLSHVVNIVDPDAIVLGGGVGKIPALYGQGVDELAKNVFNDRFSAAVLAPKLGDSAGSIGAAMLT
jgi:predicted NBD/HSP70 family sugar kinase